MTGAGNHATDPAAQVTLARAGGRRLGLALAGLAIMVGTLAAAAVLLTTRFAPAGLAYVPAGTTVVVELHADMPDGQRGALGTLLAKLPGFSGTASVAERIDAALDQLVRKASDGKHTYAGDVKPYAAGPIFIALPAAADAGATGSDGPERMLVILALQGSSGCPGLEGGAAVTLERYLDVDLRLPSGDAQRPACAASADVILLGDPASIRAALDAKASGRSVAADAGYQAAQQAIPDDYAAWMYADGQAAARMAAATGAARASTRPSPSEATPAGPGSVTPAWVATALRFVAEGAIVETVTPDPRPALLAAASGSPRATVAPDAVSAIARVLPASTIAAIELHQAGPLLAAMQAAGAVVPGAPTPGTSSPPGTGAAGDLSRLGGALSLLGGGALLGSIDQAALVITRQGPTVGGGVVIRTSDAAGAKTRLDQLRALLVLAAPGTGESDYHGARILTIPLAGLLGSGSTGLPFGGSGLLPGAGSGSLPTSGLPSGLTLAVAAYQSYIVVGLGDAFVKAVIDTPPGSSLADQSAYRVAIGLAGSANLAQAYLDLPDLLDVLRLAVPPTRLEAFERDVRPYVAPVAAVAMGATSSGGLVRSRVVLYVP